MRRITFSCSTLLFAGFGVFLGSNALAQPDATEAATPPPAQNGNVYTGDYLETEEKTWGTDAVPTHHTVQPGDTLWDISGRYFSNSWSWPKVWKLNPEIEDPHWIYPGNVVRLRMGGGSDDMVTPNNTVAPANLMSTGNRTVKRTYGLRQTAYVDTEELKDAGSVDGAVDEKSLLSTGDAIYVSYAGNNMPKVGSLLAVYNTNQNIKRDGKNVGVYVELTGEVRITFAQQGKRARGEIVRSVQPIERGMRVGPLNLNLSNVSVVKNKKKVDGSIVDLIGPDQLIGAENAVVIDRGRKDGVEVGNRFLVIRRGDAYSAVMEPSTNVGQDDGNYPARAIGEIVVLQTGASVAMGMVTFSVHEFGVGDRVYMRKGH